MIFSSATFNIEIMSVIIINSQLKAPTKLDVLVEQFSKKLTAQSIKSSCISLAEQPIPLCDEGPSFADKNVLDIKDKMMEASGILFGFPIYNYTCNSAAKALIELTGKDCWFQKPVGLFCHAGGVRSHMAPLTVANQLMLDYHNIIVPHFIYSTSKDYSENHHPLDSLDQRIDEFLSVFVSLLPNS